MGNYYEIPIIIPAYEPDEKLLSLVEKLSATEVQHICIVDDGSGEKYQHIFEKVKANEKCFVLTHAVNLGKGRALKTAFNECLIRFPKGMGCVTADSDGQHSPEDIIACMKALADHPDDLILGCRDFTGDDVPKRSSFGNLCTIKVFQFLVGLKISDTQTGLRGISTAFMKQLLEVKGERFEFETNMLMETKEHNIPITEVSIHTIYIEENSSSHFNPIKDSLKIYMMFGKFLFSSLSSSVVDLILFSILCHLLRNVECGIHYIMLSTIMARVFSAVYNFLINYRMVFKSKANISGSAGKYFVLAVCQMSLSAFLVTGIYSLVGGLEILVKIPVDVFLFFISFMIQREVVYKSK